MSDSRLDPVTTAAVLDGLGAASEPPGRPALQRLLDRYVRSVPWESASRIARRRERSTTADCPRWPDEFWRDHLTRGTGGTCFESNYAFFSLLTRLGYTGYLTVNAMGEDIAGHAALVVALEGGQWLVDVGIPLYTIIPLDPARRSQVESVFHTYAVQPTSPGVYEVTRDRHAKPYVYTLFDRPVAENTFRQVLTDDYDRVGGRFLDRIVISKVIDGSQYRFNSGERPWRIEQFVRGSRRDTVLEADPACAVATHFGLDESVVRAAWPLHPV